MSDHNECPTCLQDWVANTDYECGCCGRPASEHIRVTSLCRILRETQQREHALLVEIEDAKTTADLWMKHAKHADEAAADLKAELAETRRHWKEELAAERDLADRLAGYICDIHDVTSSRKVLKITVEACKTWWTHRKEARSE